MDAGTVRRSQRGEDKERGSAQGEKLRERGDRSGSDDFPLPWFFPSHSRTAPNKRRDRTNGKERMKKII